MATTTWADIQRLAADLQRVQLAEGTKRLSEANCVEIVTLLMSMELVHLVITTDGKEFVTRKHLVTECANECLASGGRIALTELSAQLSVDLDHVQTAVNQLLSGQNRIDQSGGASTSAEFVVCAGELVHREFLNALCARLNARLQEGGQMPMLQLTKQWELSTELFNLHILPEIGTHPSARISAVRFEDILCTPRYIEALRRKMSAVLVALTKPTSLSAIHSHFGIGQNLFFKLWNDLADQDKVPGHLLGSKNSLNSLYVPKVHAQMAAQYVKQRLSTDHFIEGAVLKRLNCVPSDPPSFFRGLLSAREFDDLLFWPSVVLCESKLWRECDALAKNILQSNHFCSIDDILPPQFTFLTTEDYAKVVDRLQRHGGNGSQAANLRATSDYSVVFEHPQLVDMWLKAVEGFVREKAAKDAPELRKAHLDTLLGAKKAEKQQKQQKDDWDMDTGSRSGGKKGKSAGAKKSGSSNSGAKRRGGATETEAQNAKNGTIFDPLSAAKIPINEMFNELRRTLTSADSLLPAESLCAELEEEFECVVNKLYRECVAEENKKAESGEQQGQREIYEQKMAKICGLYADICLYEKGTETFDESDSLFADLRAFLLRTLCTELAQSLLHALAEPSSSQQPPSQNFAQKFREQLIANLESKEAQKLAKELFDSFDSFERFHDAIQRFASHGGIILRQPDKRERLIRQDKIEAAFRCQLISCSDPPTLLLLAVLLTLKVFFGVTVHASGKFVQPLIMFISSKATSAKADDPSLCELKQLLTESQRLVVACIRKRRRNESGGEAAGEEEKQLAENVQKVKAFFNNGTNSAAEEANETMEL